MEYLFLPLWQQLSPIVLKTNHRQGDDKAYGDICNRLRRALTESDITTPNSRVFPKIVQICQMIVFSLLVLTKLCLTIITKSLMN